MWWSRLLPDTYDLAEMGYADYGGGPVPPAVAGHGHGPAVADLVEGALMHEAMPWHERRIFSG